MEDTKKVKDPKGNEKTQSNENTKSIEKAENSENTKTIENTKKTPKTFGDMIVLGRKKKGMSQEDLANIMNVSRQMVSRWELNTAMPRMQKIRKISEILDISIQELLSGNENNKLNNPVALHTFNLKKLLKVIAVILAIILILYVAYFSYKMIVLNIISSKLEQYKNLDNYYFKMESYIDANLQETNEVWYKDGLYKITNTAVLNNTPITSTTYYDINNGYTYMIDEQNKTYMQFDLLGAKTYENGGYMYSQFPAIIKSESSDFKVFAVKLNRVFAYFKSDSLFIEINNETIELDKDNFMPKSQLIKMQENKNSQQNLYMFDIKLHNTSDNDVSIPADYKKAN